MSHSARQSAMYTYANFAPLCHPLKYLPLCGTIVQYLCSMWDRFVPLCEEFSRIVRHVAARMKHSQHFSCILNHLEAFSYAFILHSWLAPVTAQRAVNIFILVKFSFPTAKHNILKCSTILRRGLPCTVSISFENCHNTSEGAPNMLPRDDDIAPNS